MDANTLAACTSSPIALASRYAAHLAPALVRFDINTDERIASFLANVAIETRYLQAVEEDLNYTTSDRLRLIFPSLFVAARGGKYMADNFKRNPEALSRLKYLGFHGRGLMHLTWQATYKEAGFALGFDYVSNPALVMEPEHACLTACWFWAAYKNLNVLADACDMYGIRRLVNGPACLGLVEVKAQRLVALKALKTAAAAAGA